MATNEYHVTVSDNNVSAPLTVSSGATPRSVSTDNGSPYYVGARAYVTQTASGAVITIIDKDGTTTATVYNGRDGSGDYGDLTNKPQIEGVTLEGDKTYDELNLISITNSEIEELQL